MLSHIVVHLYPAYILTLYLYHKHSGILFDIIFGILFGISSDILWHCKVFFRHFIRHFLMASDLAFYQTVLSGVLPDIYSDFFLAFWHILDILCEIIPCNLYGNLHFMWHSFWHSLSALDWDAVGQLKAHPSAAQTFSIWFLDSLSLLLPEGITILQRYLGHCQASKLDPKNVWIDNISVVDIGSTFVQNLIELSNIPFCPCCK